MLNSFSLLLINFCEVPCEFCNACLHLACQQALPSVCLKEVPGAAAASVPRGTGQLIRNPMSFYDCAGYCLHQFALTA